MQAETSAPKMKETPQFKQMIQTSDLFRGIYFFNMGLCHITSGCVTFLKGLEVFCITWEPNRHGSYIAYDAWLHRFSTSKF